MKALIIEDEKAAVRNLKAILAEVNPVIEVVGSTDSIGETLDWFRDHGMPDIVFMDIHLADGSAFDIFEYTDITCPIIFTTAYDEYALQAFKVNSIDYLLKPIDRKDMEKAFAKLDNLTSEIHVEPTDFSRLINSFHRREQYKTHFLVPVKGDKLLPLPVQNILFFYIEEGVVKAFTTDKEKVIFPQTLDELAEQLNPADFFRINRQYLVSRHSIRDIDLWFNGRLAVNLIIPATEKILVSKARVPEFKEWITG